jgi:uncharacterized protein YjiS (DUF1127 family)
VAGPQRPATHHLEYKMSYQTAAALLQTTSAFFYNATAGSLIAVRDAVSRFIVKRKIRLALERLDDHLLKDMGITRADIDRVSGGTLADLYEREGCRS